MLRRVARAPGRRFNGARMRRADGAELPEIEGGWAVESYDVRDGVAVRLHVPRTPDVLLDDAEVQERNRYNDAMPYWAWVWDSAPVLARQVAASVGDVGRSARALEVGAGLGLVGLGVAASLGGRAEVLLTDHDPAAVQALRAQIALNGLANASAAELDWESPHALRGQRFDVVIGCDVVYEARSHGPLLALLEAYLAERGAAWFGDPGRTRLPGFLRRAAASGWRVDTFDADGAPRPPAAGEYRAVRLQPNPGPGAAR